MILVPVKRLNGAKQRLSAVLSQDARTDLARAMLHDVLLALYKSGRPVSIVTSDSFALEMARNYGFGVILDEQNLSESDAIATATQFCVERGERSTLVIPGDVPLIEAEDVAAIYADAPERGCVLVPSADQRGTNAALRSPANLFPLRFGNDSFTPHVAAVDATGAPCIVLSLPRIALDIDRPEDLARLARAPGEKHSQLLSRKLLSAGQIALEAAG